MPITFNANTVNVVIFNNANASKVTFNGIEVFGGVSYIPTTYNVTMTDWLQTGVYGTQSSANAVTVDWGDNTPTETSSDLDVNLDHTYASAGSYTVTVTVAEGETFTVGSSSFESTNDLTTAIIGDRMTTVEQSAFAYCTSITSVVIGKDVTVIDISGFAGCTSLATVDIGESVTELRNGAFSGCTSLMSLTVRATTPPTVRRNVFQNVPATCAIYVPADSVSTYQVASGWSERAAYIQAIPS